MELYKGTLKFKKQTKKMFVYGNDDLHAQYLPKSMFALHGIRKEPIHLSVSISTVDPNKEPSRDQRRTSRKQERRQNDGE